MKFVKWLVVIASFIIMDTAVFAENSDVHTIDKTSFAITSDKPEFVLKLKSNPTTGYSWFLTDYNSNVIEPVKHSFEAPENKKLVGAPGYELWTFRVKPAGFTVPQQSLIRLVYSRPWESPAAPQEVTFRITSASAP